MYPSHFPEVLMSLLSCSLYPPGQHKSEHLPYRVQPHSKTAPVKIKCQISAHHVLRIDIQPHRRAVMPGDDDLSFPINDNLFTLTRYFHDRLLVMLSILYYVMWSHSNEQLPPRSPPNFES